ncbi:hypothetical protein QD63_004569 [Salmonella enterica subsp. enterica]|nr:hypothetical protein [Salmonella enterica subsp. enterica serovar Lexington]
MSFISYFRLRTAQQVLCVSYSVPLAIFLTTAFSPFSTWSGLWFFNYVVALMALSWGGLALYTRETDRVRQLADSREVTICNGRRVVVATMKAHEKARLVWEVLMDDDVIRRQLQVWWHGTARFLVFSIRYLPAAVLMMVWLVFWLIPDVAGVIVEQIRECPADRVVRWAAGALTSMYVITGLAWVIWNVQMDRLPVNCFREAFLAKVAAYQQCGDEMSASGTDAPSAHTEFRGDGK